MHLQTILFTLCFLLPSLVTAQHTRTEHWQDRITLFKIEAETTDTNKVVFLGNSLTEGFDLRYQSVQSLVVQTLIPTSDR